MQETKKQYLFPIHLDGKKSRGKILRSKKKAKNRETSATKEQELSEGNAILPSATQVW